MFSDFGALITDLNFAIYVHCWRIADRLSALVIALIWINFAWCPIVLNAWCWWRTTKKKMFHANHSHILMLLTNRDITKCKKNKYRRGRRRDHMKKRPSKAVLDHTHSRFRSIQNHYRHHRNHHRVYRFNCRDPIVLFHSHEHNDTFSCLIACALWEVIK